MQHTNYYHRYTLLLKIFAAFIQQMPAEHVSGKSRLKWAKSHGNPCMAVPSYLKLAVD